MEVFAKEFLVAIGAAALLFGGYIGVRTAVDPVWFVRWLNRVDPREYPIEWKRYWWVRWSLMVRDPDLVRTSPLLFWQHRVGGILLAGFCALYLLGLIAYAARH